MHFPLRLSRWLNALTHLFLAKISTVYQSLNQRDRLDYLTHDLRLKMHL